VGLFFLDQFPWGLILLAAAGPHVVEEVLIGVGLADELAAMAEAFQVELRLHQAVHGLDVGLEAMRPRRDGAVTGTALLDADGEGAIFLGLP
jgi:hypothetical protein